MKISDLFVMGIKSLSRRKARTILTVLGVVIGTLSIIIMVSIGNGMNSNFNTQIMQQGSLTVITINSNADIFNKDGEWQGNKQQALNESLIEQVKALEHVRAVSPVINCNATLMCGKYMSGVNIMAMDSSTFGDFEFPELQYGEYPSTEDNASIVFGFSAPYGFYNPQGRGMRMQDVQVDMQKQKVLLKFQDFMPDPKKKEFSLVLKDTAKLVETKNWQFDSNAFMDINYFKKIYREYSNTLSTEDRKRALKMVTNFNQIRLNVDNIENVEKVQKAIEDLGFSSYSDSQFLGPLKDTSKTMQMVLGALGAVSMAVSAISIANTMIMSIYERTKEIGIMKVLGCAVRDIRKLFLFEAAMIGLFGGLLGIGLGYLASWLINKFGAPIFKALMSGNYMYDMANTHFSIIPIYLPFASLAIAIFVGLVSGYFPARRATKIRAIEAMKTDG